MSAPSLTRRMLAGGALLVAAFLGLAGWSLEQAFRQATETAVAQRLEARVYTLLGTARDDPRGLPELPAQLPDPALNRPDSGHYAELRDGAGRIRWRSRSLLGRRLPVAPPPPVGERRTRHEAGLVLLDHTVAWDDLEGRPHPFTFTVAVDAREPAQRIARFRATLRGWLGGLGILLLLALYLAVRWGLRPLYRIAAAIEDMEQGGTERLPDRVPRELRPLTENLQALLDQSARRQERVRHGLADLAHSLRTPLTVLRDAASDAPPPLDRLIEDQVERIEQAVRHQRQRSAVAGAGRLLAPCPLVPVARRLGRSLSRLHAERRIAFRVEAAGDPHVRCDEGDLMELFGNLLENAFRHAEGRVLVHAVIEGERLRVHIDDDGPGVPEGMAEHIRRRGVRADRRHPGEGIGLAVAGEIVAQYGGRLEIGRAPLGGARFTVTLPLARLKVSREQPPTPSSATAQGSRDD